MNTPKILLIQFRDDELLTQMEYDSFVAYLGLEPEQVTQLHARKELPTPEHLRDHDALIVGGNGDALVGDDRPWNTPTRELLRYAYEHDIPTLAVCYGAQYTALEFASPDLSVPAVQQIPESKESGTYTLTLTPEGQADPLFSHMEHSFKAQQGHNDTIVHLPPQAVLLASSERCTNQAFRFPGKLFYAVQFHPELDAQQIRFRFNYYKEHYAGDMKEFQDILDRIEESTESSAILSRFVTLVEQAME